MVGLFWRTVYFGEFWRHLAAYFICSHSCQRIEWIEGVPFCDIQGDTFVRGQISRGKCPTLELPRSRASRGFVETTLRTRQLSYNEHEGYERCLGTQLIIMIWLYQVLSHMWWKYNKYKDSSTNTHRQSATPKYSADLRPQPNVPSSAGLCYS